MTDIDFSICPFIRDELCFINYYDFCKNAKAIKSYYNTFDNNAKRFYKFYVYANIHMSEYYKDTIWNYLNSDEPDYYIALMHNLTKYKVR